MGSSRQATGMVELMEAAASGERQYQTQNQICGWEELAFCEEAANPGWPRSGEPGHWLCFWSSCLSIGSIQAEDQGA